MKKTNWVVFREGVETPDGIGENWTRKQALLHVAKCEYDQNGIKYKVSKWSHNYNEQEDPITDTLQPTKSDDNGKEGGNQGS